MATTVPGSWLRWLNSTTLALIALGIFYEAWKRFIAPPVVRPISSLGVGAVAVVVNLVTALLVRRGSEHDLNLRSAFLHLMGDVLSTVGAVIAGIIIRFTGWNWLDALVSVLIGFLILWNAWGILRESLQILMESTPADIDMDALQRDILADRRSARRSRPARLEHHPFSAHTFGALGHRRCAGQRWSKSPGGGGGDARQIIMASPTLRFSWSAWTALPLVCIAILPSPTTLINHAYSYRPHLLPSPHFRSDHLRRTAGACFCQTRPPGNRDDHPATISRCRVEEMMDGVRVIRVPVMLRISKGVIAPTFGLVATRLVWQHDVVQLHLPQFDAPGVALRARLFGKPVILTYHCDLFLPPGLFNRFVNLVVQFQNNMAALLANHIVTYTQDYADNSVIPFPLPP